MNHAQKFNRYFSISYIWFHSKSVIGMIIAIFFQRYRKSYIVFFIDLYEGITMTHLTIEDIVINKDMDRKAMAIVSGGFNPQPEPPRELVNCLSRIRRRRLAILRKSIRRL